MAVSDEQILDAQYRVEDTKYDWDIFKRCINGYFVMVVIGLAGIFGGAFASDIGIGSAVATALSATGIGIIVLCGLVGMMFLFVLTEDMPSFRSDYKRAQRDYEKLITKKANETFAAYDKSREDSLNREAANETKRKGKTL